LIFKKCHIYVWIIQFTCLVGGWSWSFGFGSRWCWHHGAFWQGYQVEMWKEGWQLVLFRYQRLWLPWERLCWLEVTLQQTVEMLPGEAASCYLAAPEALWLLVAGLWLPISPSVSSVICTPCCPPKNRYPYFMLSPGSNAAVDDFGQPRYWPSEPAQIASGWSFLYFRPMISYWRQEIADFGFWSWQPGAGTS